MDWRDVTFDFSGARVLVTGGTSGIGHAIAAAYRTAGADVAITGTRDDASAYETDLSGFRYLRMRAEDPAEVDRVAQQFERLDIVVPSAGLALAAKGIDEYQPENFDRSLTLLLTSVYRLAHGCADALSRSERPGGASFIGIASMTSYFGIEMIPGYGTAKTGLVGLVRVLAVAWARRNIRVNAVAAGLTESGMTAATFDDPQWTSPTLSRTPLGRLGQPKDIAGAALFLSSSAASWITGQTLAIDGGFTVAG